MSDYLIEDGSYLVRQLETGVQCLEKNMRDSRKMVVSHRPPKQFRKGVRAYMNSVARDFMLTYAIIAGAAGLTCALTDGFASKVSGIAGIATGAVAVAHTSKHNRREERIMDISILMEVEE